MKTTWTTHNITSVLYYARKVVAEITKSQKLLRATKDNRRMT